MNGSLQLMAGIAAGLCLGSAQGQVLFTSDLDSGTGFTVLGTADTTSEFGYDYSADGITAAPNGTGTTGLKLTANNGDAVAAGAEIVAVADLVITAPIYSVKVDAWVNAVGPFPGGGAGSTEFGGIGIGHDGTTVGRNGGSFLYTGDGGSSRDYRLYKDINEQFVASGQYAVVSNNQSDVAIAAAFPGLAPPVAQGDATLTNDGTGGFQWMTLEAVVNVAAGTATYSLTSDTSGNTVTIGTLDSNLGDTFGLTGQASIFYGDLFSSIAGDANLAFGVFDNFSVTAVPEPTSLALLGVGSLAMLRRRRGA